MPKSLQNWWKTCFFKVEFRRKFLPITIFYEQKSDLLKIFVKNFVLEMLYSSPKVPKCLKVSNLNVLDHQKVICYPYYVPKSLQNWWKTFFFKVKFRSKLLLDHHFLWTKIGSFEIFCQKLCSRDFILVSKSPKMSKSLKFKRFGIPESHRLWQLCAQNPLEFIKNVFLQGRI